MKKTRFTDAQIVSAIRAHEARRKSEDIFREMGVTTASFYKWRQRYGGMGSSDVKKMKDIQEKHLGIKLNWWSK